MGHSLGGFVAGYTAGHDPKIMGAALISAARIGGGFAGLTRPQVIKVSEMVTVTFSSGGITLSLSGKALNAAAVGETLNVQNTASKKTIQALVIGPGQAVVGPQADDMKAPLSARYALR